jgi:hypothetical protein
MRAMSLLNLSNNVLKVEGVLITCETLLDDARSDTQQTCIPYNNVCHIFNWSIEEQMNCVLTVF